MNDLLLYKYRTFIRPIPDYPITPILQHMIKDWSALHKEQNIRARDLFVRT